MLPLSLVKPLQDSGLLDLILQKFTDDVGLFHASNSQTYVMCGSQSISANLAFIFHEVIASLEKGSVPEILAHLEATDLNEFIRHIEFVEQPVYTTEVPKFPDIPVQEAVLLLNGWQSAHRGSRWMQQLRDLDVELRICEAATQSASQGKDMGNRLLQLPNAGKITPKKQSVELQRIDEGNRLQKPPNAIEITPKKQPVELQRKDDGNRLQKPLNASEITPEKQSVELQKIDNVISQTETKPSAVVRCSRKNAAVDSLSSLRFPSARNRKLIDDVGFVAETDECGREEDRVSSYVFTCHQCNAVFKDRASLDQHAILTSHRPERILLHCDLCTFKCGGSSSLTRHKTVHHDPRPNGHLCDLCFFEGCDTMSLHRHLIHFHKTLHIRCDLCHGQKSSFFSSVTHLADHLRSYHPAAEDDVQWPCLLCSRVFRDTVNYNGHLMCHHQVKPFAVSTLPKKRTARSILLIDDV